MREVVAQAEGWALSQDRGAAGKCGREELPPFQVISPSLPPVGTEIGESVLAYPSGGAGVSHSGAEVRFLSGRRTGTGPSREGEDVTGHESPPFGGW